MKPDEDFEDLEQNTYVGNSRAMSWLVLAVAVGGFLALAFYAYRSGNEPNQGGDVVTFEADGTPIKEVPADAGGEQFANKDKTIYDVIAPNGQRDGEKLMPEPERPVAATNYEDEDSIDQALDEPSTAPAKPEPMAKTPEVTVEAKPEPKPQPATTTYVAEDQAKKAQVAEVVAPAPKAEEPSYAAPKMINEKPVTAKAEKPKASKTAKPKGTIGAPPTEEVDPNEEAPEDSSSESASSEEQSAEVAEGAYRIQLGAYGSDAEARAAWKKISGKYASLTDGPTIVRAEVKGKTYYRLRTGSYASSSAAKAACGKLAGQACMVVK